MALRRLEPALYAILAVAVAIATVQLAYRLHPVAPLVLAGAAGATFVAVWRPLWTVYAAIALIPLEVVSLPVGQVGISPAEGLFLLTGVCWATRRIAEGQAPWTPTPLGKPYALLLLAAVPGFAIVQDQFLVWKVVVMWTAFFFVFELIVTEGNERTVRGLLFALAVAGGIVGLVAISGAAGNEPELIGAGESATGRATGSFGHPNTLATFLGLALPGALAMGLTGRVSWRPVALAGFVAMLFALGLSLSRGGLLAVAGALGLMLLWAPFRRATLAGVAVVVFLYAAGAQPLGESRQVETVTQRIETIETSAQGTNPRFRIWDQAPTLALDSLPFGFGANNFPEVAPRYGLLEFFSPFDHAHNIPLTFLIERGIASLLALLWATVVLVQLLLRAYRRGGQTQKGLALAIGAAFTALILQGMLDYTLRANVLVAVIFCLAACAVVLARGPDAAAPADADQARPTAA
jgi:O-antigen ligase